jgi:hypothetical protein
MEIGHLHRSNAGLSDVRAWHAKCEACSDRDAAIQNPTGTVLDTRGFGRRVSLAARASRTPQRLKEVSMIGTYPFSFAPQGYPFLQSQQSPFGYGAGLQPFAQQAQLYGVPLQQLVQAIAQQLGQVNQQNQQQTQLLHQLAQIVPHQLQQIQQLVQVLPHLIQQQLQQIQPAGPGIGAFAPWQQPFGGVSTWSGAGIPQQTVGQPGTGASLGFPTIGGQQAPVM